MNKHTPGPWTIQPASTQTATWDEIYSADMGIPICSMEMSKQIDSSTRGDQRVLVDSRLREQAEANAKLIAAAPDLLEALQDSIKEAEKTYLADKESADWFNNNTPGVGQTIDYQTYSPLPEWVEKAKTIIKKATE